VVELMHRRERRKGQKRPFAMAAGKALSNRIDISFDHCIERGRPTKSGDRNWINQFRSLVVLATIVQD
jgi:hypothetical protein